MISRKTLEQRWGRVLQMIAGQSGHLPETSYDGIMGQPSMKDADAHRSPRPASPATNHHAARIYNEKLLKLPARKAADIIVDGVAANKPRIIMGNDARLVDLMVRLLPRSHPRLSAWWARRVFAE